MEQLLFIRLLFESAFCCMICDGELHADELEELKWMDKNTSYFKKIDLSDELQVLISKANEKGSLILSDFFIKLETANLSIVQEMLILEVNIRIINSDKNIDPAEVKYLHRLRSKLKITDTVLNDRFGNVDSMINISPNSLIDLNEELSVFETIVLPDPSFLKKILDK